MKFGNWSFVRKRTRLWADSQDQGFLLDGLSPGSIRIKSGESSVVLLLDGSELAWRHPQETPPSGDPIGNGELGFWRWQTDGGKLSFRHLQSQRSITLESHRSSILIEDGARTTRFPKEPDTRGMRFQSRRGALVLHSGFTFTDRHRELFQLLLDAGWLSELELQQQKGRRAPGQLEELRIELAEQRLPLIKCEAGVYGLNLDLDQVDWTPHE